MTDFRDRGEAEPTCHLPKWVNAAGVCEHPDHDPPMGVIAQAQAHRALGLCQWFALCPNEADGVVSHPILGDVPTCQRCADKLGLVLS